MKKRLRKSIFEQLEARQLLAVASDPLEPLATTDQPVDVKLDYVNQDPYQDLISIGVDGQATVAFNGNDGSWVNSKQQDLSVAPVLGFETAFLNQDVSADLVVQSADAIHVFTGSPTGDFSEVQSFAAISAGDFGHSSGRVDLELANLDSDGVFDLAWTSPQTNEVSAALGNLDGTFQAPVTFATGGSAPVSVAGGNLIGTVLPDLAVGHADGSVTFLEGIGGGQFALRSDLTITGLGSVSDLTVTDFDGDGDLDLAVAGNDQVNLLLNDNDIVTTSPIVNGSFSQGLAGWNAEVVGHAEGATPGSVNALGGELRLVENESFLTGVNQSFVIPPDPQTISLDILSLRLDDPAGGVPDAFEISLLDQNSNSLVPVHRTEATSFFNVNPNDQVSLAPGVSFDGTTVTLDIASIPEGTEATLHIELVGNPPGTTSVASIDNVNIIPDLVFADTFTIQALNGPFSSTGGLETGDVDGDGNLDIVVTDPDANLTIVFNGDGALGFTRDPIDVSSVGDGPLGVAIAPLTSGDSIADIAISLVDSDLALTPLTSDLKGPVVTFVDPVADALVTTPITTISLAFDEPVLDSGPSSPGSVTNPQSYSVTNAGPDGLFDTTDDLQIQIESVTYDSDTFETTLTVVATSLPLLSGGYRTLVEGDDPVNSVRDLVGNPLDGNLDAVGLFDLNLAPVLSGEDVGPSEEGSVATLSADLSNPGFGDSHIVTIDWGDGSVTNGVVNTTDGLGTVSGEHVYADNGVYLVTITVEDSIGQEDTVQTTATVTNDDPLAMIGGLTGTEGAPATGVLADFIDAGFTSISAGTEETFTATVDWGDSSPVETVSVDVVQGSDGVLTAGSITGTHTYNDSGSYDVVVTIVDDDGGSDTVSFQAVIGNAAPVVNAGPAVSGNEGDEVTITTSFTDASTNDTFTAEVAWSDGSTSPATISPTSDGGTISASHTFADDGVYPVAISVTDSDNDSGTASLDVTVANVAPTLTAGTDATATVGAPVSLDLASFTDPGFDNADAGTSETFTASINWGDGSPLDTGSINVTQGTVGTPTSGLIMGGHVYDAEGTYVVTVTLTDDDSGADSVTLEVVVSAGQTNFWLPRIDFETDANRQSLNRGDVITNQWADWGVNITTHDPVNHPAMIFDSSHPTGHDDDLGTPNEDFGGPGWGHWGGTNKPGANATPQGNILIISEDGDSHDPDDNRHGGSLIFDFDIPVMMDEVHLLDIDENGATIDLYAEDGSLLSSTAIPNLGENSFQVVDLSATEVSRMEVNLPGSGAITDLIFCRDVAAGEHVMLSQASSAVEGSHVTLDLTSPDVTVQSWTINWGDGTIETIDGDPSTATHTFADGLEEYSISAWATDGGNVYQTSVISIRVENVAPTLTISGDATVDSTELYDLSLASSDPGDDTISHWIINWGDGTVETINGSPSSVTHRFVAGPGTYSISAVAFDEDNANDYAEQNGMIVIEAENFTDSAIGTGSASESEWVEHTGSHVGGDRYLKASPNHGVNTLDNLKGPRLDYVAEFASAGTYYVWVRMKGTSGSDDSVHFGLNGQAATFGFYGMTDTSGQWHWEDEVNNRQGPDRVTIDVPSAGAHTLNLWMREDGTQVDRILITSDPNFVPTGIGPETTLSANGYPSNTLDVEVTGVADAWLPTIDFESGYDAESLQAGDVITDQFASLGVNITTHDPVNHPAMIFDSSHPTGHDNDLGTPHSNFGGPGLGHGGKATKPGENANPLGNILIISEDADSSDPDDNASGGQIIFTFDSPVMLDEVHLLDIDDSQSTIDLFDAAGNLISSTTAQDVGNNGFQIVTLNGRGVMRMEVNFAGSGAITDVVFCREDEPVAPETKFFVVDRSDEAAYRYDSSGTSLGDFSIAQSGSPRGATTTGEGNPIWVINSNKYVYVYDTDGETLLGKWKAKGLVNPQGIATDGTDIWIVDAGADCVYRYEGAASRLSGQEHWISGFNLAYGNKNATGLTTDGDSLFVVDRGTDKVFVYGLNGGVQNWWKLHNHNRNPSGITINPNGSTGIWVVDKTDDVVYAYPNRQYNSLGVTQSYSSSFELANGNDHPEGIADPGGILNLGDTGSGTLSDPAIPDDYVFTSDATEQAYLYFTSIAGGALTVTITDPFGNSYDESFGRAPAATEPIFFYAPGDWTFSVAASVGAPAYQFDFLSVPVPDVNTINIGDTVIGSVDDIYGRDIYEFAGTAGDVVEIDVLNENFDVFMDVIFQLPDRPGGPGGPGGPPIGFEEGPMFDPFLFGGELVDTGPLLVPADGVYQISLYSFEPITFDYEFTLAASSIPEITLDTPIAGSFPFAPSEDIYIFQGTAGDVLDFNVIDTASAFTWDFISPSDDFVFGGFVENQTAVTLDETGTYTLTVRNNDGEVLEGGTYEFTVSESVIPEIMLDVPFAGSFPSTPSEITYVYQGTAGETLDFDVIDTGFFTWEFFSPTDDFVFGGNMGDELGVALNETGTYRLRITNDNGEFFDSGTYEVVVREQSITSTPINFGDSIVADLSQANEVDSFTFTVGEDQALLLNFDALSVGSLVTTLINATGEVVETTSSSTPDDHDFGPQLTVPGEYTLEIRGDGVTTPTYEFGLLDVAIPSTTIASGDVITGSITNIAEIDAFEFDANSGDLLSIDFLVFGGELISEVIAPDGTVIRSVNDNFSSVHDFEDLQLTQTGTYQLRMADGGNDTPGYDFEISISNVNPPVVINYGDMISDTIDVANEVNRYDFAATAGDMFYVDFTSLSGGTLDSIIQDPSGTNIASSISTFVGSHDEGPFTVDADGTYSIFVGGSGGSQPTYEFTLYQVVNPPSANVQFDTPVAATLNSPGQIDTYTFNATAGEIVVFDLITGSGGEQRQRLVSPTGVEIFEQTVRDNGPITLSETGTYTLEYYGNQDGFGPYEFQIIDVPDPEFFDTEIGVEFGGSIETLYAKDIWTFEGDAGQELYFDAKTITGGMKYQVFTPSGALLGGAQNIVVSTLDLRRTLPESGDYTIVFEGFFGGAPNYTFEIFEIPDPEIFPLELNTQVNGNIDLVGAEDHFVFNADAGTDIFLDVQELDATMTARLVAPDGSILFSPNNFISRLLDSGPTTLPLTGQYRLELLGSGTTLPEYQFVLYEVPGPDLMPLPLGEKLNGEIESPGRYDDWTFEGSVGDIVFFDMQAITTTMTSFLIAPDGTVIHSANDFLFQAHDRGITVLDQDGTYTLRVDGAGDAVGSYQFALCDVTASTIPSTIAVDEVVSAAIDVSGRFHTYEIDLVVGSEYQMDEIFNTNELPRDGAVSWSVFDPAGVELASRVTEDFNFTATQTGTYTVTVDELTGPRVGDVTGKFSFRIVDASNIPAVPEGADLVVSDVQFENRVIGDPAQVVVSWTVTNNGTVPADNTWVDRISATADEIFGGVDDRNYLDVPSLQPLGPGESYTNTATITLPAGFEGSFTGIVEADPFNVVFEDQVPIGNFDFATNDTFVYAQSRNLGGQPTIEIDQPNGSEYPAGSTVALSGMVSPPSGTVNAVFVLDVSTSTLQVDQLDINGDGVVDELDDVNDFPNVGDILDAEIAASLTLTEQLLAESNDVQVSTVVFAGGSSPIDLGPDILNQSFVSPDVDSSFLGDETDFEVAVKSAFSQDLGFFAVQGANRFREIRVAGGTEFQPPVDDVRALLAGAPDADRTLVYFLTDGFASDASAVDVTGVADAGVEFYAFQIGGTEVTDQLSDLALSINADPSSTGRAEAVSDPANLTNALLGTLEKRITEVTVNGEPVQALAGNGRFFHPVDVNEGTNTYTVTAFGDDETTSQASVDFIGTTTVTGIDFDNLQDITTLGELVFERTTFNRSTNQLHADTLLRSTTTDTLTDPIVARWDEIRPPAVELINPDAVDPDERPYFVFDTEIPVAGLANNEVSAAISTEFGNPVRDRFDFDYTLLSPGNNSPFFSSAPEITASADELYAYDAVATDPDGDVLSYSLLSAPAGMSVSVVGQITWTPTLDQQGAHSIIVEARDGRGGVAQQRYDILVTQPAPDNIAPVFVTEPITQLNVSAGTAPSQTIDLSTWTVQQYGPFSQPSANWVLDGTNTVATQTVNADPSILLSDFELTNDRIEGTWRVDSFSDDDFMGFVFGYQDSQHFYLFDWKQTSQFASGFGTADIGMSVKVMNADTPFEGLDFWGSEETSGRMTKIYDNDIPWQSSTDYRFELVFNPGEFTIVVTEDATGNVLDNFTIQDDTFTSGKFGFYNYSQENVIYTGFEQTPIRPRLYEYDADAIDADNDPVNYSLLTGPTGMSVDPTTGEVTWQPTQDQLGIHDVLIVADDGRGGFDSQAFTILVSNELDNAAPEFVSTPLLRVNLGDTYSYASDALDLDYDDLEYRLLSGPAGMSMDLLSGELTWSPVAGDEGTYPVEIEVTDPSGGQDTQTFDVLVTSFLNTAPTFDSNPIVGVRAGEVYRYNSTATDAEGDPLTFTLFEGPAGMFQVPGTGSIAWLPHESQLGSHRVALSVEDPFGASDTQTYFVRVLEDNSAPVITSTAIAVATAEEEYQYDVEAFDPDDDAITFSLETAPDGMTIDSLTGFVAWTPTAADLGSVDVVVRAEDANGLAAFQSFVVEVRGPNTPPEFITEPILTIDIGESYRYDAEAIDAEDAVTYELVAFPSGMTIDSRTGLIRFEPTASSVGMQNVLIRATDERGASADQSYMLTVSPDTEAPSVRILALPDPSNVGDDVDVRVFAADNVEVDTISLTVDGVPVALDNNGRATITSTDAGFVILEATATDTSGNIGNDSEVLRVLDPADVTPPTVDILDPIDGATITYLTDIIGSVTDDNLESYQLEFSRHLSNSWRTITTASVTDGTTIDIVNDVLGVFDPTVLLNDQYDIRLTATDINGNTASDQIIVSLDGNAKIGINEQPVVDLTIPVAGGPPIEIRRQHSQLTADDSDDFGNGWQFCMVEPNLRETPARSPFEDLMGQFAALAFSEGDKVYITTPDCQRVGFTFSPTPHTGVWATLGDNFYDPRWIPDPGVDWRLYGENDYTTITSISSGEFDLDGLPLPLVRFQDQYILAALSVSYNPLGYELINKEGVRYSYDQEAGLEKVTDRNGNTLSVTDESITSSSGQQVQFQRDDEGRITAVIDPVGNQIDYVYDEAGNLIDVDYPNSLGSTYRYTAENYLDAVNPDVPEQLAAGPSFDYSYDIAGRLTAAVGALGGDVDFDYDLQDRTRREFDALGFATVIEYDDRGNTLAVVDREGNTTSYAYNDDDLVTSSIDPNGGVITFEYDSRENVTKVVDRRGAETNFVYNEFDKPTQIDFALGQSQFLEYDESGNLIRVVDADGIDQTFSVDAQGRTTAMVDRAGRETQLGYGSTNQPLAVVNPDASILTFEYDVRGNVIASIDENGHSFQLQRDPTGRLLGTTDSLGRTEHFNYNGWRVAGQTDIFGNVTEFITDSRGQVMIERRSDGSEIRFEYTERGEIESIIDPMGNSTSYTYTPEQYVEQRIDALGLVEQFEYDPNGNQISYTNPRGFTSTYQYDVNDRLTVETDPLGNSTTVSRDLLGRLLSFQDLNGSVTQYTYNNADQIETIEYSDGTSLGFAYDAVGNLTSETDALGNTTHHRYDDRDRLIETEDPAGGIRSRNHDAVGNVVSSTDSLGNSTTFEYDNLNRIISVTDAMDNVWQTEYLDDQRRIIYTDPLGRTNSSLFDEMGRRIQSTDSQGNVSFLRYDLNGRVVEFEDAVGNTASRIYDAIGRVSRVTDATGNSIDYSYDGADNLIEISDQLGNVTSFEYDALNRRTEMVRPNGGTSQIEYDASGNILRRLDELDRESRYEYDDRERLVRQIDARGAITQFEYDDSGRRTAIVDAHGNRHSYEYDSRGYETRYTDPLGNSRTTDFDSEGNLLQTVDRLGRVISYEYDALNRTVKEDWIQGGSITNSILFTYDAIDNLTSASDSFSDLSFAYDSLNRPISESVTIVSSGLSLDLMHSYDTIGNRVQVEDSLGFSSSSEYDSNSRLITRTWSQGADTVGRIERTYDARGWLTRTERYTSDDNSQYHGYTSTTYDANGLTSSIQHRNAVDEVLSQFEYARDAANQITQWQHHDETFDFSYDQTGQLTTESHSNRGSTDFEYDDTGNRIGDNQVIGIGNQLLSDSQFDYTYDAEGNLESKIDVTNGSETTYSYDHRNRLVETELRDANGLLQHSSHYEYDLFDRRIRFDVDPFGDGAQTHYSFYDGQNTWADFDSGLALQTRFLTGDVTDQLIARWNPDTGTEWYLTDHLGTVHDILGGLGQVVQSFSYDSFGNVSSSDTIDFADRFLFTGREFDVGTGLYYYRARFFDPSIGRFISADSYGFGAGDPNFYRYVGNSPASATDPSGHLALLEKSILIYQQTAAGMAVGYALGWFCGRMEAWGRGERADVESSCNAKPINWKAIHDQATASAGIGGAFGALFGFNSMSSLITTTAGKGAVTALTGFGIGFALGNSLIGLNEALEKQDEFPNLFRARLLCLGAEIGTAIVGAKMFKNTGRGQAARLDKFLEADRILRARRAAGKADAAVTSYLVEAEAVYNAITVADDGIKAHRGLDAANTPAPKFGKEDYAFGLTRVDKQPVLLDFAGDATPGTRAQLSPSTSSLPRGDAKNAAIARDTVAAARKHISGTEGRIRFNLRGFDPQQAVVEGSPQFNSVTSHELRLIAKDPELRCRVDFFNEDRLLIDTETFLSELGL